MDSCWSAYLEPCLKNFSNAKDVCVSPEDVASRVLVIFRCLADASLDKNAASVTDDSGFAEHDAETYMVISIHQMFLFACTWTFGSCSLESRAIFEDWYFSTWKDPFDRDQHVKNRSTIFPPTAKCFEYLLQPSEFDVGRFYWVPWKSFKGSITVAHGSSLQAKWASSGSGGPSFRSDATVDFSLSDSVSLNTIEAGGVLVHTPLSRALSFIGEAVTLSAFGSSYHLFITGAACGGKTSLARLVAAERTRSPAVHAAIISGHAMEVDYSSNSASRSVSDILASIIHSSKEKNLAKFYETGIKRPVCLLFVDDVNMETSSLLPPSRSQISSRSHAAGEALRGIFEHKAWFNSSLCRFERFDHLNAIATATTRPFASSKASLTRGRWLGDRRILRHAHVVYAADGDTVDSCFAAKLARYLPFLGEKLCLDLGNLTSKFVRLAKSTIGDLGFENRSNSLKLLSMKHAASLSHQIIEKFSSTMLFGANRQQEAGGGEVGDASSLQGYALNAVRIWEAVIHEYIGEYIDDKLVVRCLNQTFSESGFSTVGLSDAVHSAHRKAAAARLIGQHKAVHERVLRLPLLEAVTEEQDDDDEEDGADGAGPKVQAAPAAATSNKRDVNGMDVSLLTVEELRAAVIYNATEGAIPPVFDTSKFSFFIDLRSVMCVLSRLLPRKHEDLCAGGGLFKPPVNVVSSVAPLSTIELLCVTACKLSEKCNYRFFDISTDSSDLKGLSDALVELHCSQVESQFSEFDREITMWHIYCRDPSQVQTSVWALLPDVMDMSTSYIISKVNAAISSSDRIESIAKKIDTSDSKEGTKSDSDPSVHLVSFDSSQPVNGFVCRQRWVVSFGSAAAVSSFDPTPPSPHSASSPRGTIISKLNAAAELSKRRTFVKSMLAERSSIGESSSAGSEAPIILGVLQQCRKFVNRCKVVNISDGLKYMKDFYGFRELVDAKFLRWMFDELEGLSHRGESNNDHNSAKYSTLAMAQHMASGDYISGTISAIRRLLQAAHFHREEWVSYVATHASASDHVLAAKISVVLAIFQARHFSLHPFKMQTKRESDLLANVSKTFQTVFSKGIADPVLICDTYCKLVGTTPAIEKLVKMAIALPRKSRFRRLLSSIALCLMTSDHCVLIESSYVVSLILSTHFNLVMHSVSNSSEVFGQDICVISASERVARGGGGGSRRSLERDSTRSLVGGQESEPWGSSRLLPQGSANSAGSSESSGSAVPAKGKLGKAVSKLIRASKIMGSSQKISSAAQSTGDLTANPAIGAAAGSHLIPRILMSSPIVSCSEHSSLLEEAHLFHLSAFISPDARPAKIASIESAQDDDSESIAVIAALDKSAAPQPQQDPHSHVDHETKLAAFSRRLAGAAPSSKPPPPRSDDPSSAGPGAAAPSGRSPGEKDELSRSWLAAAALIARPVQALSSLLSAMRGVEDAYSEQILFVEQAITGKFSLSSNDSESVEASRKRGSAADSSSPPSNSSSSSSTILEEYSGSLCKAYSAVMHSIQVKTSSLDRRRLYIMLILKWSQSGSECGNYRGQADMVKFLRSFSLLRHRYCIEVAQYESASRPVASLIKSEFVSYEISESIRIISSIDSFATASSSADLCASDSFAIKGSAHFDLLYHELLDDGVFAIDKLTASELSDLIIATSNKCFAVEDRVIQCSHSLWNLLLLIDYSPYGTATISRGIDGAVSESKRIAVVEAIQDVIMCIHTFNSSVHSCVLRDVPGLKHPVEWKRLLSQLTPVGVLIVSLFVGPAVCDDVISLTVQQQMALVTPEAAAVLGDRRASSVAAVRLAPIDSRPNSAAVATRVRNASDLRSGTPFWQSWSSQQRVAVVACGDGGIDLSKAFLGEASAVVDRAQGMNAFMGRDRMHRFGYVCNKDSEDASAKPFVSVVSCHDATDKDISWLIHQLLVMRRRCLLEVTGTTHSNLLGYGFSGTDSPESTGSSANMNQGIGYNKTISFLVGLTAQELSAMEIKSKEISSGIQLLSLNLYSEGSAVELVSHCVYALYSDRVVHEALTRQTDTDADLLKRAAYHRAAWLMLVSHVVLVLRLRDQLCGRGWREAIMIGDDCLVCGTRLVFAGIDEWAELSGGDKNNGISSFVPQILSSYYRVDSLCPSDARVVRETFHYFIGQGRYFSAELDLCLFDESTVIPKNFTSVSASEFVWTIDHILSGRSVEKKDFQSSHKKQGRAKQTVSLVNVTEDIRNTFFSKKAIREIHLAKSWSASFNDAILSQSCLRPRVNLDFPKLRFVLEGIINQLPAKIDINRKEVSEQGIHHRLVKLEAKMEAVLSAVKQSKFNLNRRRHQRKRKQSTVESSREFDSLWTFALLECCAFNRTIGKIANQLASILELVEMCIENSVEMLPYLSQPMELQLNSLSFGAIPSDWCPGSLSSEVVLMDDWIDALRIRRTMLAYWVMNGSPGLVYLHYLSSPTALLRALRETYIDRNPDITDMRDIVVEAEFFDGERVEEEDLAFSVASDSSGCTIVVSGLLLANATWRFGDVINVSGPDDIAPNSGRKKYQVFYRSYNIPLK